MSKRVSGDLDLQVNIVSGRAGYRSITYCFGEDYDCFVLSIEYDRKNRPEFIFKTEHCAYIFISLTPPQFADILRQQKRYLTHLTRIHDFRNATDTYYFDGEKVLQTKMFDDSEIFRKEGYELPWKV